MGCVSTFQWGNMSTTPRKGSSTWWNISNNRISLTYMFVGKKNIFLSFTMHEPAISVFLQATANLLLTLTSRFKRGLTPTKVWAWKRLRPFAKAADKLQLIAIASKTEVRRKVLTHRTYWNSCQRGFFNYNHRLMDHRRSSKLHPIPDALNWWSLNMNQSSFSRDRSRYTSQTQLQMGKPTLKVPSYRAWQWYVLLWSKCACGHNQFRWFLHTMSTQSRNPQNFSEKWFTFQF